VRIGLSRRHRKRLRMILPPEFCQRGDAQIGKLDLVLRRIRLGGLDDRIGFCGVAGIEQPPRYAGVIAHERPEKLLSGAEAVGIAGRICDICERVNQLPAARAPGCRVRVGSHARSASIQERRAGRVGASTAGRNDPRLATPYSSHR